MNEKSIIGAALIPDKLIFRNPNGIVSEPHYISFSCSTIRELWTKFHKDGNDANVNINHSEENVTGVTLEQSFILDENSKHKIPIKLGHLPFGTWIVEYSISNEQVLKLIKDKKLNGFSVEGVFQYAEKNSLAKTELISYDLSTEILNQLFDQTLENPQSKHIGLNDSKSVYTELELVKGWNSKFGYSFSIYGNDHFIDNEPHFHFDNKEQGVFCKMSFSGEIMESKGKKRIPKKVVKLLSQFVSIDKNQRLLTTMWNEKNPDLPVEKYT